MSQSSNDVIPTAIHVSAYLEVTESLIPALAHLQDAISRKATGLDDVVVTGRTHLMDALPLRLSQELGGWSHQIERGIEGVRSTLQRLAELAVGGTGVGTGLNAPPAFGRDVAAKIANATGQPFVEARNHFALLSSQDSAVELSGQLRTVAVIITKIATDLRWMNSGPVGGLGEIALPALQPGSSMMPGKVNPVIPEAVTMACAQVIGNDVVITMAGQAGNFQLNVMLPVIAHNLLQRHPPLGAVSYGSRGQGGDRIHRQPGAYRGNPRTQSDSGHGAGSQGGLRHRGPDCPTRLRRGAHREGTRGGDD